MNRHYLLEIICFYMLKMIVIYGNQGITIAKSFGKSFKSLFEKI